MTDYQALTYYHLLAKLSKYARNQFTGRLTVQFHHTVSWRIYFNTGSIIWAAGGIHPVRRWLRQLKGCGCNSIVPKNMTKEQLLSSPYECWDYVALVRLMQDNDINLQQVQSIVEGTISEVLFDIVQGFAAISPEAMDGIKMFRKQDAYPCPQQWLQPSWMVNTEATKQRILLAWQRWVVAGLSNYNPNSGIIANQAQLNRQGWHALAQSFRRMEETEQTLRDIAIERGQNLLTFLKTIPSYFHQNLIQFKSVPDVWQEVRPYRQDNSGFSQGQATSPLIEKTDPESSNHTRPMQPHELTLTTNPEHHNAAAIPAAWQASPTAVKINVMEELVNQEAMRQMQAYSESSRQQINRLDAVTYALNRLPPLYASSQEGIAHQTAMAQQYHQLAIQTEVQRAIATVRRDPFRNRTRIAFGHQVEA